MNKHIFKIRELPILAAIALLIKLAALIEAPTSQIPGPVHRLNNPYYSSAGSNNINLYVLDDSCLITQTGVYENSPFFICVSADLPEFQYHRTSSLDCRPQTERAGPIVICVGGPANFHTAGLHIDCGLDCQ